MVNGQSGPCRDPSPAGAGGPRRKREPMDGPAGRGEMGSRGWGQRVRDSEAELGGDGGIGGSGIRHGLEHVAFTPSNIYRWLANGRMFE